MNDGSQDIFFWTFLADISPFWGPLIPQFWTSGDIYLWFQSQGGSLACVLPLRFAIDSSDSPLVRHLLNTGLCHGPHGAPRANRLSHSGDDNRLSYFSQTLVSSTAICSTLQEHQTIPTNATAPTVSDMTL